MRCLFVKAPFAGWIVGGVKQIEYRTRETLIRGRIGIIESGTGTVIGDTMLIDCIYNAELGLYEWILWDSRRYLKPIPFEHKRGAMVWIEVDMPFRISFAPKLGLEAFNAARERCREVTNAWLTVSIRKRRTL